MAYRDQPLSYRMRWATNKRERYHSDPAYRLRRINEQRRFHGKPEAASLDGLVPTWKRPRLADGKFA